MLTTIDFNNEAHLQTDKIDDVCSNQMLTLEFETIESPVLDLPPESLFGLGRLMSHAFRVDTTWLPLRFFVGCLLQNHSRSPSP
jgi:hypothetical protein